jgi:hypothetical protein
MTSLSPEPLRPKAAADLDHRDDRSPASHPNQQFQKN